jgi:hypothetical protein
MAQMPHRKKMSRKENLVQVFVKNRLEKGGKMPLFVKKNLQK